jgi:hypothetical protein
MEGNGIGFQQFLNGNVGRIPPMSRNESRTLALDWAELENKQTLGEESCWARFDYLKLRETLEAIVSAMEATAQQTELPPEESEPDATLRLVVSNDRPENDDNPPAGGSDELPSES